MTITVATTKTGFDATTDPVASATQMTFANSVDTLLNNILNGAQAFDKQLFSSAESVSIANGVMAVNGVAYTPTQAQVSVSAESGTNDTLTTIRASNNRFLVLKAAAGMAITVTANGTGNITSLDGGSIVLTGHAAALLWCQNSQWSLLTTSGLAGNVVLNQVAGIVDPTPAQDTTNGYSPGSLWINTPLDRAWINSDASAGLALWKVITPPKNIWEIRASGAAALGVGIANPTVANTPLSTNDATNTFVTMPSTAGAGNLAGLITASFNLIRPSHDPTLEWIIKTGSDISNIRLWIGLVDAEITNVDTLAAGREFIGFRFSTGVPDVGWQPVLNDGTTQNAAAAEIGTVAVDTVYKLRIRIVSGGTPTAYFSVNDSAEVAVQTNFPAIATELGMICRVIPVAASIRNLLFSRAEVAWG